MWPALRARILLVDDEVDLLDAYSRLLARAGMQCISALDSAQARQAISREHPDLVVTDLSLPDSSGLEIISAAQRESPKIPVIVMTGHGTPDLAQRAVAAGAECYLVKPVSIAELQRAIERALH